MVGKKMKSHNTVASRKFIVMGRHLLLLRHMHNLTQSEMAAELGIKAGHYWNCEVGERQLGGSARRILFTRFGISEEWFDSGIGPPPTGNVPLKNMDSNLSAPMIREDEITIAQAIRAVAKQFGVSEEDARIRILKAMSERGEK